MIKRFSVENYKGFKEKIVLDLTKTHEYKFHEEAVENGIVKKALVFGKNGTGKSNLGDAIMDIIIHLTDNEKTMRGAFRNLNNEKTLPTSFEYLIYLDGHDILYKYSKANYNLLLKEELFFDDVKIIFCDYVQHIKECNLEGTQELDLEQFNFGLSFLKFLRSRLDSKEDTLFNKFFNFVEKMLSFRGLKDNEYKGFRDGGQFFADIIIENGEIETLRKLEEFLFEKTGVNYNLYIDKDPTQNHNEIYVKFATVGVPLQNVWSTGTSSLVLFFCWNLKLDKVSFLYLDEFDAFYHYELSELVLDIVNKNPNFQSIVTTHNCGLMSNKLTRPDCCYLIVNNKIKNLTECTDREIREGHNLENLYKNGAFCE